MLQGLAWRIAHGGCIGGIYGGPGIGNVRNVRDVCDVRGGGIFLPYYPQRSVDIYLKLTPTSISTLNLYLTPLPGFEYEEYRHENTGYGENGRYGGYGGCGGDADMDSTHRDI